MRKAFLFLLALGCAFPAFAGDVKVPKETELKSMVLVGLKVDTTD